MLCSKDADRERKMKEEKWRIRLYENQVRLEDGNEGKININTHLEGWWEDGGNVNEEIHEEIWWMDRRGCSLGTWNGRIILEEDEGEAFGSLNVNFTCFSTLESFKRDFEIHIDT